MGSRTLLKTYTLRERPELEPEFERLAQDGWPRFKRQRDEPGCGRYWPALFTDFAEWQLALCGEFDKVLAVGHTVPFVWEGVAGALPDSISAILENAVRAKAEGRAPTALSALAALVDRRRWGEGLSRELVIAMGRTAQRARIQTFVAPVRPTLKASYPLTPMEGYIRWTDAEGLPFDPWMRTHARLGAETLHVLPRAMVIVGTVAAWEEWTALRFPESGPYVVPGALQPIVIDRERDEGRYEDPNVWMRHPSGAAS